MENFANNNRSNIIAAFIVAAGLIVAALIVSHRPATVASTMPFAKPVLPAPPIGQGSAAAQFRDQVLASPAMHTYKYNGILYRLIDVRNVQVTYDHKEDQFGISYDWLWQPAMPKDGPTIGGMSLGNDGYGHYSGLITTANGDPNSPSATITIR